MRTHATSRMWETNLQYYRISRKYREIPLQYQDFPLLKSNFPHTKCDFPQSAFAFFNGFPLSSTAFRLSSMAFHYLQWLSTFFNGFLIFLNGFLIFLNSFPLSKKSKKIYLRWQVYTRSPFELCISRHSLPKLRNCHLLPELHNCHLLPKLRNCHLLPELTKNSYSEYFMNNACISPNTLLWCTCVPNSAPNLKSKLDFTIFPRDSLVLEICFPHATGSMCAHGFRLVKSSTHNLK